MPRSGQHFSFGIIEGAENLPGADSLFKALTLTVMSAYEGCGSITSPSGYATNFTFVPMRATVITLPNSLIQRFDVGHTLKGLIVRTNEPVNLVLHDYMAAAGDATQLYPDDALDTSYLAAGWGLYDDPGEPNHTELLVTAAHDGTQVTITPSVMTLLGQPANVPFTVMLNAGECYMVKADTNGRPVRSSLGLSNVSATKPVSVIVGVTCAYVPLTLESCNEMMDELIGRKWWGTHFLIAPLGNGFFAGNDTSRDVEALLTSDKSGWYLINGAAPGFSSGRTELSLIGAASITTTVPTELHELALGSSSIFSGNSDPTLVTVLDTTRWADTMLWNAPRFFTDLPLQHWASIIYPSSADNQIRLDGALLSSISANTVRMTIPGTTMSAMYTAIGDGVHLLTSPVPVFALATGFAVADAYTFMPGTIGAFVPRDTISHRLVLTAEAAMACHEFGVLAQVRPPFQDTEGVMTVSITIGFDPMVTSFVRVDRTGAAEDAFMSVDSTVPGYITITLIGHPIIVDSNLFRVIFRGEKHVTSALITPGGTVCANTVEHLTADPLQFPVVPSNATLQYGLHTDSAAAIVCSPFVLHVLTDMLVAAGDQLYPQRIDISFDTTLFVFSGAKLGKLLRGLPDSTFRDSTGGYTIVFDTVAAVAGSDSLLTLILNPRTPAATTTLHVRLTYLVCDDLHTKDLDLTLPVGVNIDSSVTSLRIATTPVSFGNQASATVALSGLPASANVKQFSLFVTYNHGLLNLNGADVSGLLTAGWTFKIHYGTTTDTIVFTSPGSLLGTSGTLVDLLFGTFVTDTTSSPIAVRSTLTSYSATGCLTVYESPATATIFTGRDYCGDTLMRSLMASGTFILDGVALGDNGNLEVTYRVPIAGDVAITLADVLGNELLRQEFSIPSGRHTVELPVASLPSGAYVLRASGASGHAVRKIVLLR